MTGPNTLLPPDRTPALIVVAAPAEADAALHAAGLATLRPPDPWRSIPLNDRLHLCIAGVGKANAAGATARCADPQQVRAVLSLGLAGALPGARLAPGDTILATASDYADEGLVTPDGFQTTADMGFPLAPDGDRPPTDPRLAEALAPLADARGTIATVSTCSGTDDAAATVVQRTGALAEAMEGAAVLHAAARLALPALELRVVSNSTGDRPHQRWDLPRALARLAEVIGAL